MSNANTLTLHLDDDTAELLRRLQRHTQMEPAQIITTLFPAHLEELYELLTFLEATPLGHPLRERAENLLYGYGPATLIQDIKSLVPGYMTQAEKFAKEVGCDYRA